MGYDHVTGGKWLDGFLGDREEWPAYRDPGGKIYMCRAIIENTYSNVRWYVFGKVDGITPSERYRVDALFTGYVVMPGTQRFDSFGLGSLIDGGADRLYADPESIRKIRPPEGWVMVDDNVTLRLQNDKKEQMK